MSTKHKSINPNSIDFSATALYSNANIDIKQITGISDKDSVQWYFKDGYPAAELLVSTVLKWIERKHLRVPEDMLPHECDSLKWLDANFEYATRKYFMDVYAMEESEVGND